EDQFVVRWKSAINGATVEETFTFVHVVDESVDGGGEAPKDEGAGAAVGAGVSEAALIPEGTEWYCFRAPGASRCERKAAVCETSRKGALTIHKGAKIGKCTKQATAFCFIVVQKSAGRGAASCSATEEDCKADLGRLDMDTESGDVTVSPCAQK